MDRPNRRLRQPHTRVSKTSASCVLSQHSLTQCARRHTQPHTTSSSSLSAFSCFGHRSKPPPLSCVLLLTHPHLPSPILAPARVPETTHSPLPSTAAAIYQQQSTTRNVQRTLARPRASSFPPSPPRTSSFPPLLVRRPPRLCIIRLLLFVNFLLNDLDLELPSTQYDSLDVSALRYGNRAIEFLDTFSCTSSLIL